MTEERVRLLSLFYSFAKIGVFTFGGGYAMIPLIEGEVIERRGWVDKGEFTDLLTLAQSVPGPIAINSASFVGYKTRGYLGAAVAVLGVVIPSFVILLTVAIFFASVRHNTIVDAAFKGMRPVVVALMVLPVIQFVKELKLLQLIACAATALALWYWGFSPTYLIGGAIVAGLAWAIFDIRRLKR